MARTRSENYDGIYLGILTNAAALFSAQGYMRSSIADPQFVQASPAAT